MRVNLLHWWNGIAHNRSDEEENISFYLAELLTASVPFSSILPLVEYDNREGQMVEGIPAEEETWNLQRRCYNPTFWTRLWPFCTVATGARHSKLQDQQWPAHAAPTGVQQQLQKLHGGDLRRSPPGPVLQRADLSQEHEGVTLRSIQGKEEGAFEPSHTRQGYRKCGPREGGHTVTARGSRRWWKTPIKICLKTRRILVHEDP